MRLSITCDYIYCDYPGFLDMLYIRNLKAIQGLSVQNRVRFQRVHTTSTGLSKRIVNPLTTFLNCQSGVFLVGPGTPLTSALSNAGLHGRIFNNTVRSNVPDADRASVGIGTVPHLGAGPTCVRPGHQHCCHPQACRLHSVHPISPSSYDL